MRNKQTNIWKMLLLFSILMLFAVPSVLAAPAPSIYMNPEDSNVNCGESTTVEVRINTSAVSYTAQAYAYFDPTLVNITNVNYTGAAWQPGFGLKGWVHLGSYVTMGTLNMIGVPAGDHLFATIEIECVGCGDTSNIEFTSVLPDGTCVYNGTVTCTAGNQPQCLGMCYEGTVCEGTLIREMNCSACLAMAGTSWLNNPCPVSACNCTCDSMCWNHSIGCPECCDGIDNDPTPDGVADWPNDPKCACCIDQTETVDDGCSTPCVPELPTLALASIGILGITLLARKRD